MQNVQVLLLSFIASFSEYVGARKSLTGWNYINVHCRDNDNKPVDWWYMYKPPNENIPNYDFGRNYTFLTPDSKKRWSSSDRHITESSLLVNTLSPLYRPTYSSYLGYAVYEDKNRSSQEETSAHGLLMADEMGGLWLTHTVPGLINFDEDRPRFPVAEMPHGHLLVCVSLDLLTMNDVATALKLADPGFTRVQIPARMKKLLPDWRDLQKPVTRMGRSPQPSMQFISKGKLLYGALMTRAPGDPQCLYRKFAQQKQIVLDVYGNTNSVHSVCRKKFGVRQIESISVKLPDFVHYVRSRALDRARFAVSTAAHWQRKGLGKRQFWTCVSNLPLADTTGKGGILICMDDYNVWNSFDNFKVKEPTC